jgi:hypothetical protein
LDKSLCCAIPETKGEASNGFGQATFAQKEGRQGRSAVVKNHRFLKGEFKMDANKVTYELPAGSPVLRFLVLQWNIRRAACVSAAIVALVLAVLWVVSMPSPAVASLLSAILFGVTSNTVAYETPVTGATPPLASVSRYHQTLSAVVTGDGADTGFTITHNWHLSTEDLAKGYPNVDLEYLLAAGYTAAALIASKDADTVVFTCTAFTGAGLRVRLARPWSALR